MKIQELLQRYKDSKLSDVPWDDFPAELKQVCWEFINRWFQETSMDDLREISGFNDMTIEGLLEKED